ncbi:hypothetical protein Tco_1084243, partial [Tanacetum coccineum]
MNKRKKHFAKLRAEEKRRKPPTKSQKRNLMSTYLKNIEVVKSKEGIEESSKRTEDEFESDKSKKAKSSEKKTEGSRKKSIGKKRAGKEQKQESSKRQRIEDDKETDEHEEAKEDDEAEMKNHMEVVQDDEEIAIDAIPLATKPPIIVEYKILKEGHKGFYHLIRAEGSSNRYSSMIRMLQNISREDLETFWKLVKTKHRNTRLEDDYEKVLWGDLKVMFEPDIKSDIWRSLQGYKVTVWKLFDSNFVMSDLEHFTVTYTSIYSDDGSLDVGSPGVIVLGYDGLPMMPEDRYAYVEAAMQEPPLPDFVPEPVYPEFMAPEDDVLPAKEQPLSAAVSPTANSPRYTKSGPEEDLEEEDDEDLKEDLADYPTDRDNDEEEESSGDDADDEEDENKDEGEEEHLAPADSVLPPAYRTISRISIRAQTPIPFPFEAEVDKLLAISTLLLLPLTLLSSPTTSDSLTTTTSIIIITYITSTTTFVTPSTYILASRSETPPSGTPPLLLIPLPTSSPPLLLPSTDCRANIPKVTLLPQKRLCIAPGPRYEIRECSSTLTARLTGGFRADYGFVGTLDAKIRRDPDREIGYGITNVWVDPDEIVEKILATDVAELGQRMTDFITTIRHDTNEIYRRLDDAQDDRLLMSGQLNLLCTNRRSHVRTARLMENEARASREAWVKSMDASDMAHSE